MPEDPSIAVFVLLALPGLIALWLYESITPTRTKNGLIQIVYAIVLSLLSYLLVRILHSLQPAWIVPSIPNPAILLEASTEELDAVFSWPVIAVVAVASCVSVILSIGWASVANKEGMHRVLRWIGVTRRHGYESLWDTVFYTRTENAWVTVKFNDGDEYSGFISNHSDTSDERAVVLERVVKLNDSGELRRWDSHECLFIPDVAVVRSIRFTTDIKEQSDEKEAGQTVEAEPKAGQRIREQAAHSKG